MGEGWTTPAGDFGVAAIARQVVRRDCLAGCDGPVTGRAHSSTTTSTICLARRRDVYTYVDTLGPARYRSDQQKSEVFSARPSEEVGK